MLFNKIDQTNYPPPLKAAWPSLGISAKTVDTYKQRVNEKLGLQHRNDYVTLALKLGLLTPS